MTRTLELTPEMECVLERKAVRAGMDLDAYLQSIVEKAAAPRRRKPKTGADVVQALRDAGVLGTFSDRPDSLVWARELREQAEKHLL